MMQRVSYRRRGWRGSWRLRTLLLGLCGWLLSAVSTMPCRAESPRILLVSDPDTPEELEQSARSSLSAAFDLADASAYLAAARAQHLSPTSVAALTRLAPKARARLLVALEGTRGRLQVTLRDGNSGQVLGEESLVTRGRHPKLSGRAKHKLTASVRRALARGGDGGSAGRTSARGRQAAEAEEDDDDDDELSEQPAASTKGGAASAANRATWSQPAAAPRRPVAQPIAAPAAVPSDPEPDEPVAEEGPDSSGSSAPDAFAVRASLGGGGGARTAAVPTHAGSRDVNSGFSLPALELGLNIRYMLGSHWLLSGDLQFRTFFGLQTPETLPDGTLTRTAVSSRSFVAGVAPGYRFGGPESVDLRLMVGWAFRMLESSVATLPSASIHAAVLRPELRIPMADGVVMLRVAPELLIIVGVDAVVPRNVLALAQAGVGIGAEVSLDIRVGGPVSLGVAYRESHGMVASEWSTGYADVERYAVGRLTVQL